MADEIRDAQVRLEERKTAIFGGDRSTGAIRTNDEEAFRKMLVGLDIDADELNRAALWNADQYLELMGEAEPNPQGMLAAIFTDALLIGLLVAEARGGGS